MVQAKFLQGSIFRHILVMSSTNAIGLTALFLVDLVDLFFISLLGEIELAAAVGYAGTISFFTTSIAIAMAITMTALVSKAMGQGDKEKAKRFVINVLVFAFVAVSLVAAIVWWQVPTLLSLLGAKGRTLTLASEYLRIILPSLPILAIAMSAGAVLRSVGDAKQAMKSTLAGGAVNACLDPIFIFAMGMGLHGAAIASVIARFAIVFIAMRGVVNTHKLITSFKLALFWPDIKAMCNVAIPATMTNVATPIGNAYVTYKIAQFGGAYVAGWAVIGRIIPVAFGMIFSISGAIGPIIGQNFGAQNYRRVKDTLTQSLWFSTGYVFVLALLLMLLQGVIIEVFDASAKAAEIITLFCNVIAFSFVFNGMMFISNAAFNNLGYAHYSTLLNFAKATIGTIPFVYFGSQSYGVAGVLYGQAVGSVLFGVLSLWVSTRLVNRLYQENINQPTQQNVKEELLEQGEALSDDTPLMPFSSAESLMCAEADCLELVEGENAISKVDESKPT